MYKLFQQTFRLVLPCLWKNRASRIATIATLGITLASTLAQTAAPWLFGYLLKHCRELGLSALLLTIALLVLCWCASKILDQLRKIVFFRVINQAICDIRLRVVMHLHQVPLQAWEHYGITEIISANTRISQSIRRFMSISLVYTLPALVKIGTFSVAMWHVHRSTWYFTPLVLATYGYVYLGMHNFLQTRRYLWEATDKVQTAIADSLRGTKLSRFHLKAEATRLGKLFDTEVQIWRRNYFYQHKISLVQAMLFFGITSGLVVHMALFLRAGKLSLEDFVVIKTYIFAIYAQMYAITTRLQGFLSSVVDMKKVLDLLALPIRSSDASLPPLKPTIAPAAPILEVHNVSFTYAQQDVAVLREISLIIHQGDRIAITGPSGVGKSTLCHLLAGIYQPQQGEILLWGTPLQQFPLATIGQYVHFIDQEANLISGTIADNLGKAKIQMMPLAYLKDRLHHTAGDAGKQLSSGEKQRVLLARCLSLQPEILILDETLSALDKASVQTLLQLVLATVPTVILVTHQQSLVQDFKRIYRLEAGQLKPV
jgi:ABC-type multidrug transport system fused ATPase/permease subunit